MLIGELSRRSGVSARMLRHYDSVGLVSPTGRTEGGYRLYSAADIRRLFEVESLRLLGLPLRDLRRVLDEPGFSPSGLLGELIESTQDRIAREEELLRRLRHVRDGEPTGWTDVLRVVALMRGLDSGDASRRQRSALSDDASLPGGLLAEAVLGEDDPNVAGALRWALRRSGDVALPVLGRALDSPEAEMRRRAVTAIAELDGDDGAALLARALTDTDPAVREHAALALGARGDAAALPMLVSMIVAGVHDVESAEALAVIGVEGGLDDRVAHALAAEVERAGTDVAVVLRLVQALAEIRSPVADRSLETLTEAPDRRVALTAASILTARGNGGSAVDGVR